MRSTLMLPSLHWNEDALFSVQVYDARVHWVVVHMSISSCDDEKFDDMKNLQEG